VACESRYIEKRGLYFSLKRPGLLASFSLAKGVTLALPYSSFIGRVIHKFIWISIAPYSLPPRVLYWVIPNIHMKILSWNIWSENKSYGTATRLIRKQKPDIICLQEVSSNMLKKLQGLSGYQCVVATDFYYVKTKRKTLFHLVILSKFPIIQHKQFPLQIKQFASLVSQFFPHEESIEGHYIDVVSKGRLIRIANAHLPSFTSPKARMQQLETIINYRDPTFPFILCGDFNTFGLLHINLMVGLFYNYAWEEFLTDEQILFYKILKKEKLVSILKGTTHPWLGLQLDHIILEKGVRILKKAILDSTHGSDHQPLFTKIVLPKIKADEALVLQEIRAPKKRGAKKTKRIQSPRSQKKTGERKKRLSQ